VLPLNICICQLYSLQVHALTFFVLLLSSIEFIRPPNQLLSVASVALNNCDCTLPIFIPTQERTRKYYVGMSVPGSRGAITIRYESDEMRLNPNSMLTNLSG